MPPRYRHCGLALVRSTTDPGDLTLPDDLDLADATAVQGEGYAWLMKTWARPEVCEAITVASPDLASRLTQLLAVPEAADGRDLRRAVLSLASYILRWQRRVTPFGLFAGVLPATTGPVAVTTGTAHRAVVRPDSEWIAVLSRKLGRIPVLRERISVVADITAVARGGRLYLDRRNASGTRAPGPIDEKSIRRTRPVKAAMELASSPITFAALIAKLSDQFPMVALQSIQALLDGLIDEGFLITNLHSPMTVTEPLVYLCTVLRDAGADQVPDAAVVLHELETVSNEIAAHNEHGQASDIADLRVAVGDRMRALVPVALFPLAVDVRLDGQIALPEAILEEAAAAADVLLRLTTRPFGFPSWMEYQARFNERYGQGALVPVRELVSDSGLGYPDGFLGAPPARPVWRTLTERDATLLALIQEAVLSGRDEIRLTRADIAALTVGDPSAVVPLHRAEIAVAVQAASAEAVATGAFEIMVTGVARHPGSMAGRFAHLLAEAERERLTGTFSPAGPGEDTVAVQVSFPPRVTRNEHMTRAEPLTGAVVHIGEYPEAGGAETVSVDDLAVTANATQLYLVHVPTGRRIVPHIPHALEMTAHTPRLARFIAEVADARCAEIRPLDVGAARVLPYVPRIRYRKTILSPARWFLDRADITGDSTVSRDEQLATWRKQWRVPARIVLCQVGERLPLDLERVLDRQMLYQHLDREPRAELREDAAADADGWLGRPAELLIPLTLAEPPSRPLPVTARAGAVHHPGAGDVVCAQIIGNPVGFDTIIASRFPALARRLDGTVVRWWVRRFRDMIHPEIPQHVAIYLRLANQSVFGQAAAELGEFVTGLGRDGLPSRLTIVPYSEHPGRYGDGPALAAAEDVWAADTQAAVDQLAVAARGDVPSQALAAASMAQLAAGFAIDPAAGYRALTVSLDQGSGPLDRTLRDLTCDLADPTGGFAALRALPNGEAVAEAWGRRATTLTLYHERLSAQRDPETVLRTLLHEHHMRAVGLDPAFEKQTGRLARSAALRLLALAGLL